MEEFLIIGNLDHKWHVEGFLEVFTEYKWQEMAKVEGVWRGTPSSIEEKRSYIWIWMFFEGIEDEIQLPVSKENASPDEIVSWLAS